MHCMICSHGDRLTLKACAIGGDGELGTFTPQDAKDVCPYRRMLVEAFGDMTVAPRDVEVLAKWYGRHRATLDSLDAQRRLDQRMGIRICP